MHCTVDIVWSKYNLICIWTAWRIVVGNFSIRNYVLPLIVSFNIEEQRMS